jgi:NAD-dependent deacetylase
MVMKNVVVFSGAGMSAESGISTFRDSGGLWEQFKIEEVATPEAWARNPKKVQTFYNLRRKQILEVVPNDAHILIAQLESSYDIQVITQNIDDLHERAGSSKVLHLHGNITFSKSSGPNQEKAYYPIEGWELKLSDLCPEGYPLRPHVVWFGESVPMMDKAEKIISKADILIVIGTSLQVYPAAGLVNMATRQCEKFIIDPGLNENSIPADFKLIKKNASSGLKYIIEEFLI